MGGFFEDLANPPALVATKRAGFFDQDAIVDIAEVVFVVGFVFRAAHNVFFKLRIGNGSFDANHDCFLHFVANDNPDEGLAVALIVTHEGTLCNFVGIAEKTVLSPKRATLYSV